MGSLVGGAAICLFAFGLAGCSTFQSLKAVNDVAEANKVAPATCSKADAGTVFAAATFAGFASHQLRAAGMNPEPWSSLKPTAIIFMCYPSQANVDGLYVDTSGQKTVAPPLGEGEKETCVRTASGYSCSVQSSVTAVSP
jgi:hypothetical protein